MPYIFVIFISDIWQYFRTALTKSLKNQKFGHVKIILDKIRYFLVNILSLCINSETVDALQTTKDDNKDRQNSEITYRQTVLIFVWLVLIYGPFWSRTFLSESGENSGNIGLFKSKPGHFDKIKNCR